MQHLDEGTIHAWLDGALDSAQAAEAKAHVAQCASCSAAVAEARGLIAASSRILTALDDVPSGVIPKRAVPPVRKPARRQWRAAPWVSGIAAAALLFAIGISQSRIAARQDAFEGQALQSIPARDTTFSGYAPAAPVVPATTTPVAASGIAVAQPQRARRDGAANAAAETRQAKRVDREEVASTMSPAPPQATPLAASVQEQKLADTKSTLTAAPAPALEAVVTTGARDMAKSEAAESGIGRLAGCYRVAQATVPRLARAGDALKAVTGAVAGRGAGAAASRPQARAAEAPAEYSRVMPPPVVRLDTTRHPLGFVVRDARADTTVGSWNVVSTDSARVDMMRAGLFTFALKHRTTCPER